MKIKKYVIKWSDGFAAESRGGGVDSIVKQEIQACDDNEALAKAYILRRLQEYKYEEPTVEDYQTFAQLCESYCDDAEDVEYMKLLVEEANNNYKEALDNFNLQNIDGGAPWILNIKERSRMLYKGEYQILS